MLSTARGPFDRETTAATLRAILIDDIPAPALSPALAAAIAGLLQRDPARRATVGQAQAQLRQAAAVAAIPPEQITPAPSVPPASQPPWTGATGQASGPTTGGHPALGSASTLVGAGHDHPGANIAAPAGAFRRAHRAARPGRAARGS